MAYAFPVASSARYEGIDQGVDFTGATGTPIYAVGSGTVVKINPPSAANQGFLSSVYLRLDPGQEIRDPATGQLENEVYYLEAAPIAGLHIGQHLNAGQQIEAFTSQPISGGRGSGLSNQLEVGFARGELPYGSSSPPWPPQGQGFHDFIFGIAGGAPTAAVPAAPPTPKAQRICPPQCSDAGFKNSPECQNCRISSSVTGGIKQTAGDVGAVAHQVAAPFEAAGSALASVEKALGFLFSIRFLEIALGGMLVLLGIYLVVRQMGQEVGIKLPIPVAAVAAVAR